MKHNVIRPSMIVLLIGLVTLPESLMPTIEIIDDITGRTLHNAGKRFLIFTCDINTCEPK